MKIVITGLGHYHPEEIISNDFFGELDIGSDASWVLERTGIGARRSVLRRDDLLALRRGETTVAKLRADGRVLALSSMAERSWGVLTSRTNAAAPDAVICGTSVPDFDIPANACTVASAMQWDCTSFDVNSACSSFVVDLHVARSLLQSGAHKRIAIFNPERYSLRLDYSDRASCVLFGDGCASALVEASESARGLELLDTSVVSTPTKYELVQIPVGGTFYQNGHAVQKFAITRTIEITLALLERNGLRPSDVSYFAGHQANLRMLTSAAGKMGFREDQHLYNVDRFGNQGAAGAPAVLSMNWDKYKPGDVIVTAVVGSGLTWGAALFRVT